MNQFADKIVIVTGGAVGIGRALCLELGRRGAFVIVAGHNLERVEKTAAAIQADGGKASAALVDVAIAEDVENVVNHAIAEHGRLDYIFNNAGISVAGEMRDITLEHWRQVIDVNLMGAIHGTHFAYQAMLKQGFGQIVNMSSLGGLLPFPVKSPYSTTKHAIVGLSSTLRAEASRLGIKVNAVCPGLVATDIWHRTPILKATNQEMLDIMLVKMLEPEAAANIILKGVARNTGIITFPLHAKFAWWLYRLWPPLLTPFGWYMMSRFRKVRRPTE